jgi:hypothetical protein
MVSDGRLPQPDDFDGLVWDLRQLDRAIDRLTGQRIPKGPAWEVHAGGLFVGVNAAK